MDEDLPGVTYRSVFAWNCLDCGKANYEEGIADENPERNEQRLNELRAEHPDQPWDAWDGVEWVHMPSVVTCKHCSKRFRIAHDIGHDIDHD